MLAQPIDEMRALLPSLVSPTTLAAEDRLRHAFPLGTPCPHVAIPSFLDDAFCQALLDEFPPTLPEVRSAHDRQGGWGGKSKYQNLPELGGSYARLDALLKSQDFIDFLGRVTGIEGLQFDPAYYGGGTHESLHGEVLLPHIDFNFYPDKNLYRRLNLLLYLNEGWQDSYGGNFELCTDPRDPARNKRSHHSVAFNNAVLLATTNRSWHGFNRVELPPDKRLLSRKSVAVYYYTDYVPKDDTPLNRSTVYVDQPLPQQFKANYTLSERDSNEIREVIALRKWHVRELLEEVLRHGWAGLDRLPPGHCLSQSDTKRLAEMTGICDRYIRMLEHDHLRARNRDKPVDFSAIGDKPLDTDLK